MEENVLFYAKINSVINGSTSFAHFYITDKEIILTKHSTFNLLTQAGTTVVGALNGEYKPLFSESISKLKSISKTRFKLNGKCCLFKFEDKEIVVIFDSPAKTLETIKPLLPNVSISF